MIRKFLLFPLIVLALCLSMTGAQAQAVVSEDLLAQFESLIQEEMAYFKIPGAAVAVVAGDEVVYSQGFGMRDIAADAPFTTETRFRIGSTTKSMTSMLIAQLVDEGVLTWDMPVTELFPSFQTADPELTAQITLRDLMGMGTGLVSSTLDGFAWGDWDIDGLLDAISRQTIGGEYRDFYSYNNEVYALTGYAAVTASGLEPTVDAYRTLIQERIFDPIGMESAFVSDDMDALGENYSQSYETSLFTGEPSLMTDPPIGIVAPAGSVWTNIEDMARYMITQMNGGVTPDGTRIVSEEALAETWQPGVTIPGQEPEIQDTAYGMGWVTQTYRGVPIRYHDGGWAGYSTQMVIYPDDDIALVIFANSSMGTLFGPTLFYAFAELLHDLEPQAVEATHTLMDQTNAQIEQVRGMVSVEIEDASALLGEYEQGWQVVQRDDGSLWLTRGEWQFQLGYIEALGQYLVVNGGATGVLVSLETEGETAALNLQIGPEETLRLEKLS
jgi:CubicO group peptidase (beta-lactamase class C family)